jgi:hypothetical protein
MSDMYLTGEAFNDPPSAMGFKLENVTWDTDRQLFLADTQLTEIDLPLALIADEIRAWVDRGWTLGSYEDAYETPDDDDESSEVEPTTDDEIDSYEQMERLPSLSPRSRPASFNRFLRALVRELAVNYNNLCIAYAIDQTKTFFTDNELKEGESRAKKKFGDAHSRYFKMTPEEQSAWQKRVIRRYPRLDRIIMSGSRSPK